MKAVVQVRYGASEDVLQLREIDTPTIASNEVLVRVRAASVHADVWHVVTGRPMLARLMGGGLLRPSNPVPGTDLAGIVEAVGPRITRFKVGDAVFGESHTKQQWCNGGAFAQYAAVPEETLATIPEGVGFPEAASIPAAGYIVLLNLRGSAQIHPGHNVLINGAGGGVGSIALQIAKARGATVTAVDCKAKEAMLRRLGADAFIDFRAQDITAAGAGGEAGEAGGPANRYDLIFDVASTLSFKACKRILKPTGVYVLIGHDHYGAAGGRILGSLPHFFKLQALAVLDRQLPRPDFSMPTKREVMDELGALLRDRKLVPIVDRIFGLAEIREAMRYLQEGGGNGKIIIAPSEDEAEGPA